MASVSAILLVLGVLAVCTTGKRMDQPPDKGTGYKPSLLIELSKGQPAVDKFKQSNHVTVIYFYKKSLPRLKFFLKELEKSAEFLELYHVKIGYCDCTEPANAKVKDCEANKVENNVYTFRSGNPLLSLELETMFDVNSIMSNILQLVLLREVPILQTPEEVDRYLQKQKGKHDVVFGHMKAIGTFDHRVFMEVAYAYMDKFKFAICTDKKATTLFDEPPINKDGSTVWWVWTKQMGGEELHYHSIQYRGELNLAAFAKFAMTITLPKTFDIPGDGVTHPYESLDMNILKFYYDAASTDLVHGKANLVAKHYLGIVNILLINTDKSEGKAMFHFDNNSPPAMCVSKKGDETERCVWDIKSTDQVAAFLDDMFDVIPPAEAAGMGDIDEEDAKENAAMRGTTQMDGETEPDVNIEEVETQDDEVAEAVQRTSNIKMSLNLVLALTDKTFPQVIKEPVAAVILFYFPFDPVSMANLRMYGEVADRLGDKTKLNVARVNCYDWTDVCQLQNVTIFPTLRIFKGGEIAWDYKGPQDTQEMYSMMKLLELSPPVYTNKVMDIQTYLTGADGLGVKDITNTTVVGLFTVKNKKEIALFKQLAEASQDRILFVYTDIKEASKIADEYKAKLPAVILSKYDDTIEPHVKFETAFSLDNLQNFIYNKKLPKLSVLTPLMFPELRQRSTDFLILFTDGSVRCQVPEDAMRGIVKSQQFSNVSFTMLPVPSGTSVGYKVLDQYTENPSVPHISYVSLHKGEVFNFGNTHFGQDKLSKWLESVSERTIQPSTVLKEGKWKPLNKGYEFLKMIDREAKESRDQASNKKQKPNEKEMMPHHTEEMPDPDTDVGEAPWMEDSEDADTRKDLFDLANSRLYHTAPGRVDKHADGGMEGDKKKKDKSKSHDHTEL